MADNCLEMKKNLEKMKNSTPQKDVKFYHEISEYDQILHMEEIISMYQQEQDLKEVLFYSLNEKEDPLVLSTYYISFKTLIFIYRTEYDGKKQVEERISYQL